MDLLFKHFAKFQILLLIGIGWIGFLVWAIYRLVMHFTAG